MIIEISVDHYDRFLALCDPASREYEILKNGLVVRRSKEGRYERVVEIFGEMREAHLLLSLADKICPTATPDIAKAISRVCNK
jgi:pentatricopeptide repeat protein